MKIWGTYFNKLMWISIINLLVCHKIINYWDKEIYLWIDEKALTDFLRFIRIIYPHGFVNSKKWMADCGLFKHPSNMKLSNIPSGKKTTQNWSHYNQRECLTLQTNF